MMMIMTMMMLNNDEGFTLLLGAAREWDAITVCEGVTASTSLSTSSLKVLQAEIQS
jgi:hypothetical protein